MTADTIMGLSRIESRISECIEEDPKREDEETIGELIDTATKKQEKSLSHSEKLEKRILSSFVKVVEKVR